MISLRVLALFLIVYPASMRARDFYVTPGGGGDGDGRDWEHALSSGDVPKVIGETMQPGDRLLFGSGVYENAVLRISRGGTKENPLQFLGVDRSGGLPVFESDWSAERPDKGATALRIGPGVSHLVFRGLRFRRYMTGVSIPSAKGDREACSEIVFDDVDTELCRYGFYLSDCDDLRLENCDVRRYTKHAFRFERGCDRVAVRRCIADCSEGDPEWEKKTELLPFGFSLNRGGAPNTGFVFEDCLAANNLMPLQKNRYKNGDGFVVEGNARDVAFLRCRAIRNQDSGFDLKVPGVRLTGCVALRNARNFRIWSGGSLENCFSGWAGTGLWSNGETITVKRCTFYRLGYAVMTDDRARGPVALTACLVSRVDNRFRRTASGGKATWEDTEFTEEAEFVAPKEEWDGLGDAMNSRAFPEKGYRDPGA